MGICPDNKQSNEGQGLSPLGHTRSTSIVSTTVLRCSIVWQSLPTDPATIGYMSVPVKWGGARSNYQKHHCLLEPEPLVAPWLLCCHYYCFCPVGGCKEGCYSRNHLTFVYHGGPRTIACRCVGSDLLQFEQPNNHCCCCCCCCCFGETVSREPPPPFPFFLSCSIYTDKGGSNVYRVLFCPWICC